MTRSLCGPWNLQQWPRSHVNHSVVETTPNPVKVRRRLCLLEFIILLHEVWYKPWSETDFVCHNVKISFHWKQQLGAKVYTSSQVATSVVCIFFDLFFVLFPLALFVWRLLYSSAPCLLWFHLSGGWWEVFTHVDTCTDAHMYGRSTHAQQTYMCRSICDDLAHFFHEMERSSGRYLSPFFLQLHTWLARLSLWKTSTAAVWILNAGPRMKNAKLGWSRFCRVQHFQIGAAVCCRPFTFTLHENTTYWSKSKSLFLGQWHSAFHDKYNVVNG